MTNNSNTNIERIIAKIDNDFNPDNSDWIPRVGAWAIDAMAILDVTQKEPKKRQLEVRDGIAYSPCPIDANSLKVYDANGCRIKKAGASTNCCTTSLRGDSDSHSQQVQQTNHRYLTHRTVCIDKLDANKAPAVQAVTVNSKDLSPRHNVVELTEQENSNADHNYVLIGCDKIEVNFDTPYITIESDEIITESSDIYGCELPVIPNNGLLIEAIAYYCMYKMLCRGYKHPVMNLSASQYGTNPYYEWNKLKDEAKRKSIIDAQGKVIDDSDLWNSAFYIYTFLR